MSQEVKINPEIIKTANMLWDLVVVFAAIAGVIWIVKWSFAFSVASWRF